jgi:AcrR family transcriptional regulator
MTITNQESPAGTGAASDQQRIVQAAIGVFVRDGFPESTLDDVVTASGLPGEVVRRYFPTKYELIGAVGAVNKAAATGMLMELMQEKTLPSLDDIVGRVGDFFDGMAVGGGPAGLAPQATGIALYDDILKAIMQDVNAALIDGWTRLAARLVELGRLPRDTDPADVGATLFCLVIGYMSQRLLGNATSDNLRGGLRALLG